MCSCLWPSWWESRMRTVSLWLNSSVSNSSSMSLWRTRNCLSWRTTESKDWIKSSKAKQSGYLWVMFESCFSSTSTKCSTKVLSYVFSLPQIRAEIISTYALCGFANFSSLGIVIGGLCRCFVIPSHCCPYFVLVSEAFLVQRYIYFLSYKLLLLNIFLILFYLVCNDLTISMAFINVFTLQSYLSGLRCNFYF